MENKIQETLSSVISDKEYQELLFNHGAAYRSIKNAIQGQCYKHRTEPFTLASGRLSHHYFDLRKMNYHPSYSFLVGQMINNLINTYVRKVYPDKDVPHLYVAGTGLGAAPMVFSVCAYKTSPNEGGHGYFLNPVMVREAAKTHGTGGNLVHGIDSGLEDETFSPEDRLIFVVEDVITTGKSATTVIEALQGYGRIAALISILDREEEGRENLKAAYPAMDIYSFYKKTDFAIGGEA